MNVFDPRNHWERRIESLEVAIDQLTHYISQQLPSIQPHMSNVQAMLENARSIAKDQDSRVIIGEMREVWTVPEELALPRTELLALVGEHLHTSWSYSDLSGLCLTGGLRVPGNFNPLTVSEINDKESPSGFYRQNFTYNQVRYSLMVRVQEHLVAIDLNYLTVKLLSHVETSENSGWLLHDYEDTFISREEFTAEFFKVLESYGYTQPTPPSGEEFKQAINNVILSVFDGYEIPRPLVEEDVTEFTSRQDLPEWEGVSANQPSGVYKLKSDAIFSGPTDQYALFIRTEGIRAVYFPYTELMLIQYLRQPDSNLQWESLKAWDKIALVKALPQVSTEEVTDE